MNLDQTTIQLFAPFDEERQVGKYRSVHTNSLPEFEREVDKINGIEEVYTNVFPLAMVYVDRVLFDFDGDSALRDFKKIYSWTFEADYPAIPVITGKKGFQLHIFSKPIPVRTKDDAKILVADVQNYILRTVLGVTSTNDRTSVDFHLVGNVSALCRVPNTLRPPENVSYCSYLPSDFCALSEQDIYTISKAPHFFSFSFGARKSFLELPIEREDLPVIVENQQRYLAKPATPFKPADSVKFLREILPRDLLQKITEPNPIHKDRFRFALEMFEMNFSVDEIVDVIVGLKWMDFSERITRSYLNSIAQDFCSGKYRVRF